MISMLTGDLIEYIDPDHLKKTLENLFKNHNADGALYQLKDEIIERFSAIVRHAKLSPDDKAAKWKKCY